jgi:hypothetical protein
MSLDVEVETVEEHWYAGVLKEVGDVYAMSPDRALKLVNRGKVKKVGVVESEQAEEPVELEPVEETESEEASEDEAGDDSSEDDED